jgi:hypothetical protein
MEMTSGHFGVSDFDHYNRESARLYAFVLHELGIAGVEPVQTAAPISAPHAAKRSSEPARAMRAASLGVSPRLTPARQRKISWTPAVWPRADG